MGVGGPKVPARPGRGWGFGRHRLGRGRGRGTGPGTRTCRGRLQPAEVCRSAPGGARGTAVAGATATRHQHVPVRRRSGGPAYHCHYGFELPSELSISIADPWAEPSPTPPRPPPTRPPPPRTPPPRP